MDGSGYPRGLQGNQIRLEAKILAVADVFETISSHRPYRPSLGQGRAIDEISQKKGELYDPAVSETCLAIIAKNKFRFDERRNSFGRDIKPTKTPAEKFATVPE